MITLDTWIISDTHFRHKNIIKYANRPMNHDNLMMKNWKELVKPTDPILHLGDVHVWYGPDKEVAAAAVASLPGDKFLILGNHDEDAVWHIKHGFSVFSNSSIKVTIDDKKILFSHYPEYKDLDWDINIHGHIHINGYPPECDPTRDYRNVSIEVMGYKPVRLHQILYSGRYKGILEQGYDVEKLKKRRR